MRIRATFTHPHPAAGVDTDAHLVVSVHGETSPGMSRPRIAVVPVVDRSGSMATADKLGVVTRALTHLSSYLGPTDRLALVAFDHTVATPVPMRAADPAGAAAFTTALSALSPRGSTNLHDALTAAITAANRTSADTLARIIVLTDGRANAGPSDRQSLTAALAERAGHVTCSFLGVGTDCDHTLLGQLAEAGGGSYGFIEAADAAADVLGAEVGGLLDVEAHQVSITVTGRGKYTALTTDAPLGHRQPTTGDQSTEDGDRDTGRVTIAVPQLLRGVTRNFVIPVRLRGPRRPHARPVSCADVHVRAVIDDQEVTHQLRPKVQFCPEPGPVDPDLTVTVDLATVADAFVAAREHAAVGNFAAAHCVVDAVRVTTGAASGLLRSMAGSYTDAVTYASAAPALSSAVAAVSGSLSGSSQAFDALASRTIGAYRSQGQRVVAANTAAAVHAAAARGTSAAANEAAAVTIGVADTAVRAVAASAVRAASTAVNRAIANAPVTAADDDGQEVAR